ncbi:uncharacterized protein LOC663269 [Tribolium castaneum]|uniref:Activator of basal transcription 1 n=1 Tax=Tribolium castaneum TaxID=7070 RepID=D6WLW3_TRICA|nr:PREDICTED: pre-rRNA-processing protein esf2 [Tribolium castaneum]EFA04174.1 Pre-rRNA-processing protein esf2-like Protein [Tribolium castaneum]|eukprot:XP_974418.1 PREDICTED: pre-rRNA-processing protein esf2 [Tribolium castaneum]
MVEVNNTEAECSKKQKKPPKRGIVYLSTIPPYMNVTKIREVFGQFGKIGRVYLQLAETEGKNEKKSKRKVARKFTEGWVEFERKSVAKRVAQLLNNTQVSTRKKSKQFDCIWSIKYLSNFKWTHLHERLAYEKAARRQKLRAEIQLAKKKTNFFTANLDKKKKGKDVVNKELENIETNGETPMDEESQEDRTEFLQSLFS